MNRLKQLLFLLITLILTSCVNTYKLWNIDKEINLYEKNNMHFIDITLNDINGKLLIDTGASKSLLDISKAEKYKFNYILISKDKYVGIGGLQDIYVVYNVEITQSFIEFLGTDLSEIQKYFIKDGISIIGILGVDYLEKHNCIIDFKKNKLYIGN